MNPIEFVTARLAEGGLAPPVEHTYRRILAIAEDAVSDGDDDDVIDWLLGADEEEKALEYLFGADPASEGERLARQLVATLAATWEAHPDFDPTWRTGLPGGTPTG